MSAALSGLGEAATALGTVASCAGLAVVVWSLAARLAPRGLAVPGVPASVVTLAVGALLLAALAAAVALAIN